MAIGQNQEDLTCGYGGKDRVYSGLLRGPRGEFIRVQWSVLPSTNRNIDDDKATLLPMLGGVGPGP